jgi:exopolysaccharide biosynthesis polyprenyl glycosylphosphotransferase
VSIQERQERFSQNAAAKPVAFFDSAPTFPLARPRLVQDRKTASSRLQTTLKRFFDLTIAIPALLAVGPIMALIALLIRLDSRGPALFWQTRLGLGGRPFAILKFRSMSVQENGADVRQAQRNDARVTGIGRWLRASSLDELPQLINVIRGEMSLVGPRPHAWAHDEMYDRLIANYSLRQAVKPGITGWAQVHGHRGETSTLEAMRRRVDLDIWYTQNASLALDFKILLRTPLEVLSARNAY